MQRSIIHSWNFPHPVEKVWDYLTKPELLSQWLMQNDFQPIVGHTFMFTAKPRVKLGFDGNVYCQVLEVVPYKKLAYSWKGGPRKGRITLDSVVTWTLTPKDGGTQLLLEHSGFAGMKNYISYIVMSKGWNGKIRQRLTELLNAPDHALAHS